MPINVGDATQEMLVTHALTGAQIVANGQAFVMEQGRMQHMRTSGVADAIAAQEVRTSAQAREILQSRAASDQPQGAK